MSGYLQDLAQLSSQSRTDKNPSLADLEGLFIQPSAQSLLNKTTYSDLSSLDIPSPVASGNISFTQSPPYTSSTYGWKPESCASINNKPHHHTPLETNNSIKFVSPQSAPPALIDWTPLRALGKSSGSSPLGVKSNNLSVDFNSTAGFFAGKENLPFSQSPSSFTPTSALKVPAPKAPINQENSLLVLQPDYNSQSPHTWAKKASTSPTSSILDNISLPTVKRRPLERNPFDQFSLSNLRSGLKSHASSSLDLKPPIAQPLIVLDESTWTDIETPDTTGKRSLLFHESIDKIFTCI